MNTGEASLADLPQKQSKRSKPSTESKIRKRQEAAIAESIPVSSTSDEHSIAPMTSKKPRKRAADFLSDEEQPEPQAIEPKKKSQKAKDASLDVQDIESAPLSTKTRKKKSEALTADGVNGVIEKPSSEVARTTTAKKSVKNSLQEEAQRTVDKEIEDEFGPSDDDDDEEDEVDVAGALLTGFDSDTEDPAQDQNPDLSQNMSIPNEKKTQKKLLKAKTQGGNEEPGTVYVGRIPHGFYEKQMRDYFSQFGDITRLRVSRNKRTGASKHFAFIEFKLDEVAKIVAETMDNYLMFGHILKCKYAPQENLHPDLWKGANKKFRKLPFNKLERQRLAAPKSKEFWETKVAKEKAKRTKLASKLKSLGYDMPESELTNPAEVLEKRTVVTTQTPAEIEHEEPSSVKAIEAAETGDLKKAKNPKKSQKMNLDEKNGESVVNPEVEPVESSVEKKTGKKNKKEKPLPQLENAVTKPATTSTTSATGEKAGKKNKTATDDSVVQVAAPTKSKLSKQKKAKVAAA